MLCKCTNDFKYKVVGLCENISCKDISTDGKTNWTEFTVPEVLVIPHPKPAIESIDKIYIKAEIKTLKVIQTPISPDPNSEGLMLTGRKLIVDGYLCQNIMYTADNCEQTVHLANFKIPFSTYIVLPKNTNITDKFEVTACVEDVYATLLNSRTIFKNVTLFLQAIKK